MPVEGNPAKVTFTYAVTGVGWSRATISDGTRELAMRVSYLSDALRDLIDATIALMRGAEQATCLWLDEPGGYTWTFDRVDDEVTITIVEGQYGVRPIDRPGITRRFPDPPAVLFVTRCPLRRFAGQVLTQSWHILSDLGLEGYKETWRGHEFPLAEYQTLEQLMKAGGGP